MGDNFRLAKEIAQLASRQHGNVTRAQLRAVGLSDAAIHRRARTGMLFPSHRGVYSVGRPPVTPLERAVAAVLACGPGAVLSHGSAMTLWGFWSRWETPFEVTITGDRRPRGIRVHRSRTLESHDFARQLGIPVTTPARTLLDIAPRLRERQLTRVVKDGLVRKLVSADRLEAVIARHPTYPGAAALAQLISTDENPTRSNFEDGFPEFCERFGLPRPVMNAIVCGFEVDALFEAEKVIVELDGWGTHSSRISFEADRERDAVTTAGGYQPYRMTKRRFDQQQALEAQRLHAILADRRRIHSPPR